MLLHTFYTLLKYFSLQGFPSKAIVYSSVAKAAA